MNDRKNTEQNVKRTLESLDGIKKAEPQPFFYTRLIGRLQKHEKTFWESAGSFLARPAVAAFCLVFILVFNGFLLFRQDSDREVATSQPAIENVSDNESIVASNSSFDYENLDQQ